MTNQEQYELDCKNATFTNEEREKYFYTLINLQSNLQLLAGLFQNPMVVNNDMLKDYYKAHNEIIGELSKIRVFIHNKTN